MEIETGAETLKELAEWILALPKEQQNYRVYTTDSEYGPEPWHGVMEMRDEEVTEYDTHRVVHEPRAIVSDSPTQAEYAEFKAKQERRAQERRIADWNRPEVQEAKRRGLLPLWPDCRVRSS